MSRSKGRDGVSRSSRQKVPGDRIHLLVLIAFLVICFIGGGSARADTFSLLFVRPAAFAVAMFFVIMPGPVNNRAIVLPLSLLAVWGALIGLQLVPLPPEVWASLPERARFAQAAEIIAAPAPWRPLTFRPDLTWNSLIALSVPLAVLLGLRRLGAQSRSLLVAVVLAAIMSSATLSILQLAGGEGSALRFYRYTHDQFAVGLFANRNHQAAFLAIGIPLLRQWCMSGPRPAAIAGWSTPIFFLGTLLIILCIVATGSRMGAVGAALGLVAAFVIKPFDLRSLWHGSGKWALVGGGAAAAFLILLILNVDRESTVDRLLVLGSDLEGEHRIKYLPIMVQIARDMLPWGAGAGTFDPVFRIYEPDVFLTPRYFNQAHNDFLDVVITGGIPALLVLGCGITWFLNASARLLFSPESDLKALGVAGAAIIGIVAVASIVDYPVRTPILAAILALATVWLGEASRHRTAPQSSTTSIR